MARIRGIYLRIHNLGVKTATYTAGTTCPSAPSKLLIAVRLQASRPSWPLLASSDSGQWLGAAALERKTNTLQLGLREYDDFANKRHVICWDQFSAGGKDRKPAYYIVTGTVGPRTSNLTRRRGRRQANAVSSSETLLNVTPRRHSHSHSHSLEIRGRNRDGVVKQDDII